MTQTTTINQIIDKTWIESVFSKKGIHTILLETEKSLMKFIYDTIPDDCIVAISSSLITKTLKIKEILLEKGNKIYYSWSEYNSNRSLDTFEDHQQPKFFITMADSISYDGSIVSKELNNKQLTGNVIAFSLTNELSNISGSKDKLNVPDPNIILAIVTYLKAS